MKVLVGLLLGVSCWMRSSATNDRLGSCGSGPDLEDSDQTRRTRRRSESSNSGSSRDVDESLEVVSVNLFMEAAGGIAYDDSKSELAWESLRSHIYGNIAIDSRKISQILNVQSAELHRDFQRLIVTKYPREIKCVLTVELTVPKDTDHQLLSLLENHKSSEASIACVKGKEKLVKERIGLPEPEFVFNRNVPEHAKLDGLKEDAERLLWTLTPPYGLPNGLSRAAPYMSCRTFKTAAFEEENQLSKKSPSAYSKHPRMVFESKLVPDHIKLMFEVTDVADGSPIPQQTLCSFRKYFGGVLDYYYLANFDFNNLKPEVLAEFSWVPTPADRIVLESVFRTEPSQLKPIKNRTRRGSKEAKGV